VIPLYGFLAGDTIGLLILAHPDDTAETLCQKLQSAAAVRVAPLRQPVVVHRGKRLHPRETVKQAAIEALDRFDVQEEGV
jgi:hypothetical protein